MALSTSSIPGMAAILALGFLPAVARAEPVTLPSMDTPAGYVALLLVNEVPFPGDTAYVSEQNSKQAMRAILAVLVNRIHEIPPRYTQSEVAGVRTRSMIDIITAGGVGGQVEGFYKNDRGQPVVLPRVSRRAERLQVIANQGTPGTFASLLDFAATISESYFKDESSFEAVYADVHTVNGVPVTGRGYAWMTNIHSLDPGGSFVLIPKGDRGTLGGNRFFTLRKRPEEIQ